MFRMAYLFLLWVEHMMCLCSLAWPSVLLALLQPCAIPVLPGWINSPFLPAFFWSIPMTLLGCHWPCSSFLDFVMVRCWKYWGEALRWQKKELSLLFSFPTPQRGSGSWMWLGFVPGLLCDCEHVELQTSAFSGRMWHYWIRQNLV